MAGGPPIRPPMGGGMPPGAGGPVGGPPAGGNPLAALMGGGGGGPGGGMIAQVIQQLMSNPAAIKGMMNFLQGAPPTAGIPVPPSKGGPMPGAGAPPAGAGAPPAGAPPQDPAEKMAAQQIDQAGNTWDGVDAPTKGDIARLVANPTPAAIKSFDAQFGKGMAEKYIAAEGGGSDAEDQADQGADESEEASDA